MCQTTTKNTGLKTPISYYGGKQKMLKHILPLIPQHHLYVEPFFGGGAVFWAKEPCEVEIINDYNDNVVNFYRQLKGNYRALKACIDQTPYSRATYKRALTLYELPFLFGELERAWAFWVCCIQEFCNIIGSWRAVSGTNKEAKLAQGKKELLTQAYTERLQHITIECNDALYIIDRQCDKQAFFYCDPPYVGSDQGHYGGYTQQHFDELLEALSRIKGKFLLSSYPNASLDTYIQKYDWVCVSTRMNCTASPTRKLKTEVLVANYDIRRGSS